MLRFPDEMIQLFAEVGKRLEQFSRQGKSKVGKRSGEEYM
jgi:hypothetical protein